MGVDEIKEGREQRSAAVAAALKTGKNPLHGVVPKGPRYLIDHGTYIVAWDEPQHIQFDFDLVTTERSGDTSAEVTIYTTGSTDTRAIHRTRLNLLSTIAHQRLAKHLADRTKHLGLDWPDLIDQACQISMSMFRAGEPAILLRDAPTPPAGASLLPPLLASDGATILFGDGGTGKSYLALAMAASVHTGTALVAGMGVTARKRVGFCDWEWADYVHRQRLIRLWGSADDLPDIVYVPCRLSLSDERDRLRRIIREQRLEFLVIDSVALAAGGEPESAEVAIKFFAALRVLDVPTLLIAHVTNAAAKTSADRPFGSAFWHNSARSTWYAKKSDGSNDRRLMLGLYNRKSNDAALAAPIGLALEFGPEATAITKTDVRDEADLDAVRSLRYRIMDELRLGPAPVERLALDLDAADDSVRKTLRRGEGRVFQKVIRDGQVQWGLAENPHD